MTVGLHSPRIRTNLLGGLSSLAYRRKGGGPVFFEVHGWRCMELQVGWLWSKVLSTIKDVKSTCLQRYGPMLGEIYEGTRHILWAMIWDPYYSHVRTISTMIHSYQNFADF